MRYSITCVLLALIASPASAATPPDDPARPIRLFIDAFNKGDVATGFAMHAPGEVSITDEFAPYHWNGRDAAQAWAQEYERNAKANGISNGHVGYGAPTRIERAGDRAYVVLPTQYSFRQRGHVMTETGSITATVVRTGKGWRMSSWTWSSPAPHPQR